jgi:hypothetical protein
MRYCRLSFLAVALVIFAASSALAQIITCVAPPSHVLTTCGEIVTYNIPSDVADNASALDSEAGSDPALASFLPNCMYYSLPSYACQKVFPRCTPATTVGANATAVPVCRSVCEAGRDWTFDRLRCSMTVYDPDCSNNSYFINSAPPQCTYFEINEQSSSTPAAWKWALVGIASAVGLAIILYILIQCYRRSRVSPELTDADIDRPFEHEVARRKKLEQRAAYEAKQREKEEKRAAKANARAQNGGEENHGSGGEANASESPKPNVRGHENTNEGIEMQPAGPV